ncbi:MAG TPA: sugar transferase [Nitriliruptorales bacterium]|nr:sugar transferase [Nitriliruptorales bacterium]
MPSARGRRAPPTVGSRPSVTGPLDGSHRARRLVDVVVAATALTLLVPLLMLIAVAIVVSMGPPLLFHQQRSGLDGREFTIVKFRTMRPEREPGEADRDRTTRLGALLRSLSLDELPQLWNVLVGDMSLVGPRPTLPEQVVHYDARQRRRLRVRPGLTGYAQVMGRNRLSWPERIELDLWYLDHRSLVLDLRIVGRTLVALVRREGIYGAGGVNRGFPAPVPSDDIPATPPSAAAGPVGQGQSDPDGAVS